MGLWIPDKVCWKIWKTCLHWHFEQDNGETNREIWRKVWWMCNFQWLSLARHPRWYYHINRVDKGLCGTNERKFKRISRLRCHPIRQWCAKFYKEIRGIKLVTHPSVRWDRWIFQYNLREWWNVQYPRHQKAAKLLVYGRESQTNK